MFVEANGKSERTPVSLQHLIVHPSSFKASSPQVFWSGQAIEENNFLHDVFLSFKCPLAPYENLHIFRCKNIPAHTDPFMLILPQILLWSRNILPMKSAVGKFLITSRAKSATGQWTHLWYLNKLTDKTLWDFFCWLSSFNSFILLVLHPVPSLSSYLQIVYSNLFRLSSCLLINKSRIFRSAPTETENSPLKGKATCFH